MEPAGIALQCSPEMAQRRLRETIPRALPQTRGHRSMPPERMPVKRKPVAFSESDEPVAGLVVGLAGAPRDHIPLHLVFGRDQVAIANDEAAKRFPGEIGRGKSGSVAQVSLGCRLTQALRPGFRRPYVVLPTHDFDPPKIGRASCRERV